MKKTILFFTFLLLGASLCAAQTGTPATPVHSKASSPSVPVTEKLKPFRIPRTEQAVVIDGSLDEEAWSKAAVFRDFLQTQPGDNIAPSQPTEVLMTYDARNLYIAFRAHDDAGKVRATISKRDAIFEDDNVGVYLDTFNDRRKAYALFFNPLGVQADGIYTEGKDPDPLKSIDFSVDVVMTSKGLVGSNGYVIEVAIPFKSLRYEAGTGKFWGVHLFRQIKRLDNEQDSWMPISRDRSSVLDQEGAIVAPEDIWRGYTLEIVPSITVSEEGKRVRTLSPADLAADPTRLDPGRLVNQPSHFDPGVSVKFGITPTATLDFAYNPDFAQVEADQIVVTANQRFPIFFEEKRPFFLEGIDIFQTPLTPVHTRAIVDPDQAIKLTGKVGRNSFGILLANDNGPGNITGDDRLIPRNFPFLDKNAYIGVLRLKRDIGRESTLGMVATTYNFIQKHNHLGGIDGRFRLSPTRVFTFQALGTTSRRFFFDPDLGQNIYRTGNGFAYSYNVEQKERNWVYNLTGEGRTRDYRADVGFTRRTNINSAQLLIRYNSTPRPKARLISWRVTGLGVNLFDWQGRLHTSANEINVRFNFRRQTYIASSLNIAYDRLFEEEFGRRRTATHAGTFLGDDSERHSYSRTVAILGGTVPSKKFSAAFLAFYDWNDFDFDFGAAPRFPRVSRAALLDPSAPLDPGPGNSLFIQGNLAWRPTDALRVTLDYTKSRLVRKDTKRTAFDDDIYSLRGTYQFTRFVFARARVDYDTLAANEFGQFLPRVRGQFVFGWTPNPGTAFYAGYNDDLNRNGFSPFTDQFEPGLKRNGRTFFIKMSYLLRRSL